MSFLREIRSNDRRVENSPEYTNTTKASPSVIDKPRSQRTQQQNAILATVRDTTFKAPLARDDLRVVGVARGKGNSTWQKGRHTFAARKRLTSETGKRE